MTPSAHRNDLPDHERSRDGDRSCDGRERLGREQPRESGVDASRRVILWHAASSAGTPGLMEECCCQWLPKDELNDAQRFKIPTSRNQHVVGRGMARRLLGGERVAPQSIRFGFQTYGKPYVLDPEVAKQPFNVAHTDGLVLCGIGSRHLELIGVDVERWGRRTDPDLANRFFSQPEVDYLNNLRSDEQRHRAFLKIWTLKESFIKAIGTGLQTPLADFAFRDIDSDRPSIEMLKPKLESNHDWRFFSITPRPGFVAAVAVAVSRGSDEVVLEVQSFDEQVTQTGDR